MSLTLDAIFPMLLPALETLHDTFYTLLCDCVLRWDLQILAYDPNKEDNIHDSQVWNPFFVRYF